MRSYGCGSRAAQPTRGIGAHAYAASKQVPIYCQTAGQGASGLAVWDYHVILIQARSAMLHTCVRWLHPALQLVVCYPPPQRMPPHDQALVWDLDTTLLFPCSALDYAQQALRCQHELLPQFRRCAAPARSTARVLPVHTSTGWGACAPHLPCVPHTRACTPSGTTGLCPPPCIFTTLPPTGPTWCATAMKALPGWPSPPWPLIQGGAGETTTPAVHNLPDYWDTQSHECCSVQQLEAMLNGPGAGEEPCGLVVCEADLVRHVLGL